METMAKLFSQLPSNEHVLIDSKYFVDIPAGLTEIMVPDHTSVSDELRGGAFVRAAKVDGLTGLAVFVRKRGRGRKAKIRWAGR